MSHRNRKTTYEHPLNEQIRAFLRVEYLLDRVSHTCKSTERWDSHATVLAIIDILLVIERIDIRKELLRVTDILYCKYKGLNYVPEIDQQKLTALLDEIKSVHEQLITCHIRIGQSLKTDPILSMVRQRSHIPGGISEFDLPAYHHWLSTPTKNRTAFQHKWLQQLELLSKSVRLVLRLIRYNVQSAHLTATKGRYQQMLEAKSEILILTIRVDTCLGVFPEVSGNKHRFNIRFVNTNAHTSYCRDLRFTLGCCSF